MILGDRPTLEKIEVTPAMIEAGVNVIYSLTGTGQLLHHQVSAEELALVVYRAMHERPTISSHNESPQKS